MKAKLAGIALSVTLLISGSAQAGFEAPHADAKVALDSTWAVACDDRLHHLRASASVRESDGTQRSGGPAAQARESGSAGARTAHGPVMK